MTAAQSDLAEPPESGKLCNVPLQVTDCDEHIYVLRTINRLPDPSLLKYPLGTWVAKISPSVVSDTSIAAKNFRLYQWVPSASRFGTFCRHVLGLIFRSQHMTVSGALM